MFDLDPRKCSKSADTCPIVDDMFSLDTFYAVVEDVSPEESHDYRTLCGAFVDACSVELCPGINDRHMLDVLRTMKETNNE